jgi:hypothetical protein
VDELIFWVCFCKKFCVVLTGVFQGVFGKTCVFWMVFYGEVVVFLWWDVVFGWLLIGALKNITF